MENYADILLYVKMSEIPFKKMNAFLAQIDIGLIKSFFFNLLNFLDILLCCYTMKLIAMAPQNQVLLSTITVGLNTIPPYLHPPLIFKVLIDAVQCISKSKYRQSNGQKTNNDIYMILHRKLRVEKR